jgi:hypothetical protein
MPFAKQLTNKMGGGSGAGDGHADHGDGLESDGHSLVTSTPGQFIGLGGNFGEAGVSGRRGEHVC